MNTINIKDNYFTITTYDGRIFSQNLTTGIWEEKLNSKQYGLNYPSATYNNKTLYWDFNKETIIVEENSTGATSTLNTSQLTERCRTSDIDNNSFFQGSYVFRNQLPLDGGDLWFGCPQGLAKYNLQSDKWTFVGSWPNYPAVIYKVYTAHDGTALVSTNLGIGLIDPKLKKWHQIYQGNQGVYISNFAWVDDDIYFLDKGSLGMGPSDEADLTLVHYQITSGKINQSSSSANALLGRRRVLATGLNRTWLLAPTSTDGYDGAAFVAIDSHAKELRRYQIPESIASSTSYVLAAIEAGPELWFVSKQTGLASLDPVTGKFTKRGIPTQTMVGGYKTSLLATNNTLWTNAFHRWPDHGSIFSLNTNTLQWNEFSAAQPVLHGDDITDSRHLSTVGKFLVVLSNYPNGVPRGSNQSLWSLDLYNTERGTWWTPLSTDGLINTGKREVVIDTNDRYIWISSVAGLELIDTKKL
jgi:frataxin-like iron-binding protein CyaY